MYISLYIKESCSRGGHVIKLEERHIDLFALCLSVLSELLCDEQEKECYYVFTKTVVCLL